MPIKDSIMVYADIRQQVLINHDTIHKVTKKVLLDLINAPHHGYLKIDKEGELICEYEVGSGSQSSYTRDKIRLATELDKAVDLVLKAM